MMKHSNLGRRLAVFLPLFVASAVAHAGAAEITADGINISGISRGAITRKTQVRIADLDLGQRAGQRALESRISYATRQVCDNTGIVGLQLRADYQSCVQGARSSAQEQLAALTSAQPAQLSMR